MFADHHFTSHDEYTLDLKKETSQTLVDLQGLGGTSPQGESIAFTNFYMTYNNHPCIPVMGEFHYSRFPRHYWKQALQKMRAGGVQIVATYLFWIHIEEEQGIFDWSGDRDIHTFLEVCQSVGLQVLLRIGPFAHGECRNGGLPDWLYGQPFPVRSNDPRYLSYVQRFFAQIAEQVTGFLFAEGGPVIGFQIDNEYMHAGAPWEVTYKPGTEWVPAGSDGVEHMQQLKQIAVAQGLQAPMYSCTGWVGSPVPEHGFLPMQGGYAFMPWNPDPEYQQEPTREFLFRDRHLQPLTVGEASYDATRYPYASCELGGGIQITYYHRPIVPPECVQSMAVIALGSGANLLGYYMYHGGSNPVGKHAFMNEFTVPRISYDFQAPVGEYGQIHASYHHLRALHLFLQDFGELLAPMEVALPAHYAQIAPEDTSTLRHAVRSKDGSGFLFLNNYQDHVTMQNHEDVHIRLELPDESLVLPHAQKGLTLGKDISAILPFNMLLGKSVLLKYATAQVLTTLHTGTQLTYVFFAPDGMHAEFALDRATYRNIEVMGGVQQEEGEQEYAVIDMQPGLQSCIQVTALDGTSIQIFVLTQEQAYACWKVPFKGQERLILTNALILQQDAALHLSWREQESTSLAIYPPLTESITASEGWLAETKDGHFTRYTLAVAAYQNNIDFQQLHADTLRVTIPATALDGVQDVYLRIDYLGDMGHAYLNGQLVSDHFANGLPWEIGLKRFMAAELELILHFTPLQQDATTLRYFPTGMAFRPLADGTAQIEIHSTTALPEYQTILT